MRGLLFFLFIIVLSVPLILENISGKRARYTFEKLFNGNLDASESRVGTDRDYQYLENLAPSTQKPKPSEEDFDEQENSDEEQENEELEEST
jgi:hypothetical protein